MKRRRTIKPKRTKEKTSPKKQGNIKEDMKKLKRKVNYGLQINKLLQKAKMTLDLVQGDEHHEQLHRRHVGASLPSQKEVNNFQPEKPDCIPSSASRIGQIRLEPCPQE